MIKKVVCIGDSIILGRIDEINQGWVSCLRHWWVSKDPVSNMIYNLGIGGNTSEDILKRLKAECSVRKPDAIIFGFGVNDMRRLNEPNGPFLVRPEEFSKNLQDIIEASRSLTPVIGACEMVPINERLTTPHKGHYWYEEDQKTFQKILDEVCARENVPMLRYNLMSKFDRTKLTIDGIHPPHEVHLEMFEAAKVFLENLLRA